MNTRTMALVLLAALALAGCGNRGPLVRPAAAAHAAPPASSGAAPDQAASVRPPRTA